MRSLIRIARRAAIMVAASTSLSCLGQMEARLRIDTARAQKMALICESVLHGDDDQSMSMLGGAFEWQKNLPKRLASLVAGPQFDGTIDGKHGLPAEDVAKALKERAEELTRLLAALKSQAAGEATTLVAEADAAADAGIATVKEKQSVLLDDLEIACKQLTTISVKVTSLSNHAKKLKELKIPDVKVSLDINAQLASAQAIVKAFTGVKSDIGTLASDGKALLEAASTFASSVDRIRRYTDIAVARRELDIEIYARLETALGDAAEMVHPFATWISESQALVEKLSAAANIDLSLDADSLQRQSLALLNDVGGALLRRRSTPLAKQLFRATSSSLQFIDRQIAYLASQGYGLGAVAAMFASSAVDHMTENVGVRLGTLIGRLGIGGKAFVFEACRAVGEQQDSVVVLGMTTFYQGFITGYGAGVALLPADSADLVQAPAPESADQAAGAEPPEASALLRKLVLASYGADDQDVANTIGGGGSASSGALRDARERLLADSSDLPVETTDIYADWLAVNACYRGLGWHPRTTACDRERTRDAVAAILVEGVPLPTIDPRPKVVEGGGGGTERIETSTSSASELRVFESMLIERSRDRILLWPGGAAGGAGGAGDGVTKVDASAFADVASDLARKMADQHALVMDQHSDLLCEMRQKERHWRTTQFVAALCGIAKDEKIATCSDRKEIDAVATLSLNKQLMPDGEWAVYAGDNGKGFPRFGTCDTCCESTKPDLDNKPYCDRLRSDRGTSLKRLSRFGVRYTNLVRYEDDIASLAYNIEAIERQFNADNSHTITVSGRASSSAYLCKLDLLPRLMTGGNTAPPKCGGKPGTQRPSEGELCWEELDQKLYLRSSIKDDDIWCSTKGQDSWGKSMSDDYSKCVGGLDSKKCKGIKGAVFANDEERRERDANTMLSVLRGWRAAKVLRDKLPPSWSRRVHFEAHPQAPARCTSNTEDCFKYQTVGIRILPDLAATTYSCSNRSVTPP